MKNKIYTLTAIFSAAAIVLLIIRHIKEIYDNSESYFDFIRDPVIAVLLALCVLSLIQFKKHTPRLMLVFCGYVFVASSITFGTMLLMAAAFTPAIYELSHYGAAVRREPKMPGLGRWRWLPAAAITLAAFRLLPLMFQSAVSRFDDLENYLGNYTTDIMGICALVCFAVFCSLANRRTSGLYRMFFTGCILFDAIQTVLPLYGYFSDLPTPEPVRTMFVFFEVLYALFILLIVIHAFLTRRSGLLPQETSVAAERTETPAA